MKKGFTLIELLVTVSLIGILAGTLIAVLKPAELIQRGRDSRRITDLDSLLKAINLALADGEITLQVGGSGTSSPSKIAVDGTGWVVYDKLESNLGLAKYLPVLPLDPGTGVYSFASNGTDFEINATFEHADNAVKMTVDGGNNPAIYEVGTDLTLIN